MGECEYWQALISRMLDGDLSAEEEAALAKHLEGCEECRTLYGAFAAVSGALAGQLKEPPERLRENVMAQVRRDAIRKKNTRRPWRAALAVAAAAALAIGLRWGVLPNMGGTMKASVQELAAEETAETAAEAPAALPEIASDAATADEAAPEVPLAAGAQANTAFESEAQANMAFESEAQANTALDSGAAETRAAGGHETIRLPELSFAELLEKLDGEPCDLRLDSLGPLESVTVVCRDNMLTLFSWDGDWYYYDPADPAPRQSRLAPDGLRALAEP